MADEESEFHRGLGLFDATMVVVGGMIGSGIFVVSAEMSRQIGSPGWLLVAWLVTGVLTVAAALSYGELAGMMPQAGGQYVFLREAYSPLFAFLYGWTFLLVIQTGTIAAVAVAFAKFAGLVFPAIDPNVYLIEPIHLAGGYAISLSRAQFVAILLIALLTATNMRGLHWGKLVQNVFTVAKIGALLALIVLGLTYGWNSEVVSDNWSHFWTVQPDQDVVPGLNALTSWGLLAALCVAQTGSLFSADSWHSAATIAPEIRDPRRNVPLSLGLGTGLVIVLYMLANVAYLVTLPLAGIQHARDDRVGTAAIEAMFPGAGVIVMAIAIMVSTFGCNNGLILVGARAAYAMARDRLFFSSVGKLNAAKVPANGLWLQGIWASFLVLPRTIKADGTYGNLYGDLLDYVISAALLFYILTVIGIFRLRVTRPDIPRPYRAFGYPVVPALYVAGASAILGILFMYRRDTTWPGLVIVLLGLPMYLWLKKNRGAADPPRSTD
ncbi:MAG: APC family permease [Planctomycetes bacterium]|nr:APC family permease [Planctomycetota bacterium]